MVIWPILFSFLTLSTTGSMTHWYRKRLAQIRRPNKRGHQGANRFGTNKFGSSNSGARTRTASNFNKYRNFGRKPFGRKPVPRLNIDQTQAPTKPPAQVKINPPAPTEFKGPPPEWVVIWQKGDFCHGNTVQG